MGTRRIIGALAASVLLVTLWGCGGSAATSASTAAAQPSTAASQAEPSAAESSAAGPSSAEASFAIPSFVLPSGAKDLEALLPATLCGETAIKASMSGDQFTNNADATFKAILASLGKQASDVSFAIAVASGSGCTAGIFRIAGVDQNLLQQTFVAQEQKTGATISQGSVGGKAVYISTQNGAKEYVYFKGDAVIFAQGKDEASAASILQQLP
jgi:hypothetical protein